MRKYVLIEVEKNKKSLKKWLIFKEHLTSDTHIDIKYDDNIRGKVYCRDFEKENFNFKISKVSSDNKFFINKLIDKEEGDPLNKKIFCILQLSRLDFFEIPFRINKQNLLLHKEYFKKENYHYFPVKVFSHSFNNRKDFESEEEFNKSELMKSVIRLAVRDNFFDKSQKYFSLLRLLSRKFSVSWLWLWIPIFIAMYLIIYVFKYFPYDVSVSPFLAPFLEFFLTSAVVLVLFQFTLPLLSINFQSKEKAISSLLDLTLENFFINKDCNMSYEIMGNLNDIKRGQKNQILEKISKITAYKYPAFIILVASITLAIHLLRFLTRS